MGNHHVRQVIRTRGNDPYSYDRSGGERRPIKCNGQGRTVSARMLDKLAVLEMGNRHDLDQS
jgi:hypothetical protein